MTVFTKNRDRLLAGDIAAKFLSAVVAQARARNLLSDEHFSVDGTLLDAWASMKSFRPKEQGGDEPPGPGREEAFQRAGIYPEVRLETLRSALLASSPAWGWELPL